MLLLWMLWIRNLKCWITEEQEKLKKLPPNRVGANFDHSSHTDANWLPSFGRVWNSGRRWQSRWALTSAQITGSFHSSRLSYWHISPPSPLRNQFREEEANTRGKRKWKDDGKATKKQKGLSNGELWNGYTNYTGCRRTVCEKWRIYCFSHIENNCKGSNVLQLDTNYGLFQLVNMWNSRYEEFVREMNSTICVSSLLNIFLLQMCNFLFWS